MTCTDLLSRLDGVRPRGTSKWSAKCAAHADKSPSLSISDGERGILLKCWAGCSLEEICQALNIRVADLFPDAKLPRGQRPAPKPMKLDRIALAFRYELAAFDLRLRAERIIEAGKGLNLATMTDTELDTAIGYMAQAHADRERATLFEGVADTLRTRDFTERKDRERHTQVA